MQTVIIRYGEIFLKSEPVKRRFLHQLVQNIHKALDANSLEHRIETQRGRILIFGPGTNGIAELTSRIFGVVDVSIGSLTSNEVSDLSETALRYAERALQPGMSFAVRARREGTHEFTSQELAAAVGAEILRNIDGISVDLDRPNYEIFVEVRPFGGLVYDNRIPAPGGLPWGTQGRVLSLISGGLDSPVASWLMMRRGCETTHLYLDGGCWVGRDRYTVVTEHHRLLSNWCRGYPLDLLVVDSEPFYQSMVDAVEPRYRCVICKRFMLKVGSLIATEKSAYALVTGDNLGQVASQTLVNMALIDAAASVPVLRPLITYDKGEIVDLARKIGTFEQTRGELCCRAVPRHPATAALPDPVQKSEARIDLEGLAKEAAWGVKKVRALNGKIEEAI
ncbi:MAG TPA: tRNA uracil 4-sulfurtransferase ThiI [Methanomicrobiales archaeon]|nr:tRNA uracil 4-sulfurtransferase ThiI [Methanomicrobiales archaeon]